MKKKFYGKWKKLCASVLAVGMLVTSCPVEVFGALGDDDNGCLKVYGRGSVDGGAVVYLNNQISKDKTYTVSAWVKYTGGAATRTINITAEAGPNWQYRKVVKAGTAKRGEWTEIKTENYQPSDGDNGGAFTASEFKLFFETPYGSNDLDDFYIDNVVITENGGDTILNESFDSDAAVGPDGGELKKFSKFSNAKVEWLEEGDEKLPDPSEIVPLQENGDAETGDTDGWAVSSGGGESAALAATTEQKYEGSYSLKVTDRANCASGPMQDLSQKLTPGRRYKITGRVKYTTGPDSRDFEICYQYGKTWQERTTVKKISVKKDRWVQLYGVFKAEKNVDIHQVFVSTTYNAKPTKDNDLMDFYVDNIVITLDDGEVPALQEHECIEGSTLVSGALKAENNNTHVNPLFDYKFGADPYAITYNGRVYVYTTNDSQQYESIKNNYGYPTAGNAFDKINTLNVFSSADMVNWTDHGEVSVAGKGAANLSWAPAVGHKTINGQEKFFLYFANGGGGIYVLESDSPIGPFEAPATGSTLITKEMPQGSGIPYLFDPAVLVDDDGTGYLYYGGGFPDNSPQDVINNPKTFRVVKLKDNMVEVDGDAKVIEAPGNFEDSGIHKHNGKYYFTYCSNFANNLDITGKGNICAMVSDNPMEGFTFQGIVFPNQATFFGNGTGGNNHHCFFDFNGKHYLTYHAQTLAVALEFTGNDQSGYRSIHIDEFEYGKQDGTKDDGTINVEGTWGGSEQVKDLDPYGRVEAETIAWSKGIKADTCTETGPLVNSLNMKVTEITNGDYLAVSSADFGEGSGKFTMHVAGLAGGTVELHLDGTAGTKVGEVTVPAGDGETWSDVTCYTGITGKHNLYLVFKGKDGEKLMEADYWKFDRTTLTAEQKTAATSVADLIDQIGEITEYNEAQETKVKNASTKYNELTAEQKGWVANADILKEAEQIYQGMANVEDAQVKGVIVLINKIGTVTGDQTSKAAIDAAKAAYNKLTDAQKNQVTNKDTLTTAEQTYQGIKDKEAADAVIAKINKIGTVTEASKAAIDAAKEAYNKLTDAQKELVTNADTLTAAEQTYQGIKDKEAADAVIALINGIGTVTGDQASLAKIDAAKTAFNNLTEAQKKLVTNAGTLTAAEQTYQGIKDQEAKAKDKEQVDAVIALINKIGTVTGDQTSKAAIDAARAAYDKLTAEQKKLVTNVGTLTVAEQKYQEIKNQENASVKAGESYDVSGYRYTVLDASKQTVAVSKALKDSKTIKVPNTVTIKGKSYKVTEIAKGAFKNSKKLETATIGKNVTKIGANAFSGSKKLKKVTINSTALTTIDKQAFKNCKKLATVKIVSKKLKTVAKQSFKGTAKKIKVDVPNNKIKAYKKLFKKQSGISSKAVYK